MGARITDAKRPLLDAIIKILDGVLNDYWPVSLRQIHYNLLNDPPLRHASRPATRYANKIQSYRELSKVATTARIQGIIPMDAIADDTRPEFVWKILKQVAADFCVPMRSGRGYSSLPPRYKMHQRFIESGKEKLVLLIVSDFDPSGEDIAESFARSMRDDFKIGSERLVPIKVAITLEQIRSLRLPKSFTKPGKDDTKAKRFKKIHGPDQTVYEVEALAPENLQKLVRDAMDSVLDIKAFNREVRQEKSDAAKLMGYRKAMIAAFNEVRERN